VPVRELDERSSEYLCRLLEDPIFEVLPLASSLQHVRHLATGARVNVAASPRRGLEATVSVAGQLEAAGFRAVPHIAARMVRDRAHLRELLDRLADAGIRRAFVVAGDATDSGPFPSGLSLLRELAELDGGPVEIGIPGYPQGHPFIPTDELWAALAAKAPYASYLTSQLSFDALDVLAWLAALRARDISLPVHIGLAGVVHVPKLLAISARIGVTDAARFVVRHGSLISRLLRPRGYRPGSLVTDLLPGLLAADAHVERLHFYTFNQVAETETWRRRLLQSLHRQPG
jgi:methylenetetrahydrofolate reductase (NADPH)